MRTKVLLVGLLNVVGTFLAVWGIMEYPDYYEFEDWIVFDWAIAFSLIIFPINFLLLAFLPSFKDDKSLIGLWFEVRKKRLSDELKND